MCADLHTTIYKINIEQQLISHSIRLPYLHEPNPALHLQAQLVNLLCQ